MTVILNERGTPQPPTDSVMRLKGIHPDLGLKYIHGVDSHWGIIMEWGTKDRRWEFVKNGSADPDSAFDIIGYLPTDCSLDEAPAHIERVFRQFPREDVQGLVDRVAQWNAAPAQKAAEEAFAEILDSSNPDKVGGVEIAVEVTETLAPSKKAKKPRKKAASKKKTARKSKYLD
mgnify:FL=1|tara:strand:+ start:573 stop:1094 length:522 start_codon:yes stop_codon:yes gene_type:complete